MLQVSCKAVSNFHFSENEFPGLSSGSFTFHPYISPPFVITTIFILLVCISVILSFYIPFKMSNFHFLDNEFPGLSSGSFTFHTYISSPFVITTISVLLVCILVFFYHSTPPSKKRVISSLELAARNFNLCFHF